jgi:hypothetical protein
MAVDQERLFNDLVEMDETLLPLMLRRHARDACRGYIEGSKIGKSRRTINTAARVRYIAIPTIAATLSSYRWAA